MRTSQSWLLDILHDCHMQQDPGSAPCVSQLHTYAQSHGLDGAGSPAEAAAA